nr:adenine deaminase [Bacillus benzoevorans]
MWMDNKMLIRRIAVAAGREPADLVIKNGKIIDVFNAELIEGDVAIADGYIAGIGGTSYSGRETIDAKGCYISPAFIDGHVHIESSMVTPQEFAKVLLHHGVTTVICDPHEIANVAGAGGIQFMLDSSENLPVDILFMLPSCVPAVDFERSGAILNMEHLRPFLSHPRVLGLAEVMNYPAVRNAEKTMIEKLLETAQAGKKVDGHAAGLSAQDLNIYTAAGIRTDHEATTIAEAEARLQRGMYVMIREGTAAKDLKNLIGIVNERNARRCLFVTDDKHLDDLIEEGSIDYNVKLAVQEGLNPITAVQMASLNAAECFGLHDKGAVAPGYQADLLLLDSLEEISIVRVLKSGKSVWKKGALLNFPQTSLSIPNSLSSTVSFQPLSESDFAIPMKSGKANIIEIIPNSLITKHLVEEVAVNQSGHFEVSITHDQLKLAVIERHKKTRLIGVGIVKGLGLKSGAIASTVGHDSHNLIVTGVQDHDMLLAANEIQKMQGGLIVVKNGEILASLELPIAGLISTLSSNEVFTKLKELNAALKTIGAAKNFNPFLTLSFLSLPVIPELKLTADGLFHIGKFEFIDIHAK